MTISSVGSQESSQARLPSNGDAPVPNAADCQGDVPEKAFLHPQEKTGTVELYNIKGSTIIIGDAREMNLSQFPERYGVIIADCPWPYRVTKGQGIAKDQYSTMSDAELRSMPVPELAAENCILFMWGTWPKIPECIELINVWGFDYVTGFPWIKTNSKNRQPFYGIGHWVRGCSEYVLIGRKGKISPPRLEGFLGLLSPNLQHSRKPDSVHEIAETLPGPYLELFARCSRPGWTVFGNQIQGKLV